MVEGPWMVIMKEGGGEIWRVNTSPYLPFLLKPSSRESHGPLIFMVSRLCGCWLFFICVASL